MSPLLVDPVVETGHVTAQREPLHVVMRYERPEPRTVTLDATRLIVTWPGRTEREEINIAAIQSRVQRYFVDVSADQLRESFDITLTHDAAMTGGTEHLAMLPRRRQIRDGLVRLDLWIDPARLLLVRMFLAFPSGDTKTFDFRDFEIDRARAGGSQFLGLLQGRRNAGGR